MRASQFGKMSAAMRENKKPVENTIEKSDNGDDQNKILAKIERSASVDYLFYHMT